RGMLVQTSQAQVSSVFIRESVDYALRVHASETATFQDLASLRGAILVTDGARAKIESLSMTSTSPVKVTAASLDLSRSSIQAGSFDVDHDRDAGIQPSCVSLRDLHLDLAAGFKLDRSSHTRAENVRFPDSTKGSRIGPAITVSSSAAFDAHQITV